MANPWWVGVDSPDTTVEGQAPTKAVFARQNFCTLENVYGPFTQDQANNFNPPAFKGPSPPSPVGNQANIGDHVWWVVKTNVSIKGLLSPYQEVNALKPPTRIGAADVVKVWGPYTKKQADAKLFELDTANVTGPLSGIIHPGASPFAPLKEIGDFFHRLTEKETYVRGLEIVAGIIVAYVGVRAMTSGSTAIGSGARQSVTRPVKKATKAVSSVVVPEARLATRVTAKRVAPKTTARVAAHRETVAKYGQKKPYRPPPPRPVRQPTVRVSHIYHHKGPKKP